MKAEGHSHSHDSGDEFNDGCTEEDIAYLTNSSHFAVRALCMACRHLFSSLCLHDQIIINGMLSNILQHKPATLEIAMREHLPRQLLRTVLVILRSAKTLPATASNYCGIAINEIEEFLDPTDDHEE